MATILVTGGTGTLGRALVDRLLGDGHDVRSLSRRPHTGTARPRPRSYAVDLRDGTGLPEALAGVETVVHCASTPSGGDTEAAGRLIAAARAAGVAHLVYISIVGVDLVPIRYYRTKLAVERLIEGSGLGWTVLRTTQLHDLVLRVIKAGTRSPVLPVPTGVRVQPVEVGEVADRLAELAAGGPAGRVADLGGPEVLDARDLVRATLAAGGRRRLLMPLWLPGASAAALRRGGNLTPEHADGRRTYAEFLAARTGDAARR
ncbi:NAD(P)H-binding protein [Streptomyces angustmyceticus]|uniref:Nucleotide-diphosphate-sugar epimerase n=1 Tax=Streptomyces angustmyceticus TaxID=285578 RepID=A0A5J4LQH3_9ACTN|nr:NAD(P)H-binding protein [Streptomyces angustmyceticus]UAL70244.1 NAD(P)H-binding protein [Streptomyces angustmyceticus]GES34242.1 nucleotide-diphosphate-sugar epimerase [Streptomyces angustmyceticus]